MTIYNNTINTINTMNNLTHQCRAEYASPVVKTVRISMKQTVLSVSDYATDTYGAIDEIE